MVDSDSAVFSWILLKLEGDIRAASGMYELFWEQLILKYAPNVVQERYNEEFICNNVMWCNTSFVRLV